MSNSRIVLVLALFSVLTLPLSVRAGGPQPEDEVTILLQDRMALASGDPMVAIYNVVEENLELAGDAIYLERDLAVARGWGEMLEKQLALADPPWWEKVWDHDLMKVVLFVLGVELGRRFVVVK